uniref:Uncharacterized protein LOC108050631 n=1 Tax=Drosophila rhopaloa TaxID=1041015 RepID=A0A6P4FCR5_DRORH
MSAFQKSNICWCNCHPNSYREIQKKIQNYCAVIRKNGLGSANPQNSRDLLVHNEQKTTQMDDKDAYEICCKLRKRQKEDNIARKRNQPVLFEKEPIYGVKSTK